jgi:hypothetical protein
MYHSNTTPHTVASPSQWWCVSKFVELFVVVVADAKIYWNIFIGDACHGRRTRPGSTVTTFSLTIIGVGIPVLCYDPADITRYYNMTSHGYLGSRRWSFRVIFMDTPPFFWNKFDSFHCNKHHPYQQQRQQQH